MYLPHSSFNVKKTAKMWGNYTSKYGTVLTTTMKHFKFSS